MTPAPAALPSPSAPPCPVCGHAAFRAAFRAVGHAFERCRACSFTRMADARGSDGLEAFYRADLASAASAADDHDKNLARFDGILQRIERHRRPGRFLDVGCSIGTSLVVAQRRGWQALGLELAAGAVETARARFGVDVRAVTLEQSGLAPGSVDAVLMHHTLEHVPAPDALLAAVHAVLAPGGVMYQSLPNHGSLKARLLGRHFGYGITDEHLSHFTARHLRRLVRRVGFEVLAVETRSYRQDPRLLHDVCARLGLSRWLARRCGVPAGEALDVARYVAYLNRSRWAFAFCNHVWPQRLCRLLRLGEDLHLLARKPG